MRATERMMSLIGSEVCATPLDLSDCQNLSENSMKELYYLSKHHDVAHIVCWALEKGNMMPEYDISEKFKEQMYMAIYRYENIRYEYQRLCRVLDDAGIAYLPLKGAVIRSLYPEPWMRTSCDIDLLFHPEDIEPVAEMLCSSLHFTRKEKTNNHDISVFSQSGVHVELHFDLIESNIIGTTEQLLGRVWEFTELKENSRMYLMSDDMFYFYHVAHMVKHFTSGGCGVRPFLDLWLLNNKVEFDREKRELLLSECGLLTFARVAERLSEVWFSGKEPDDLTERMQYYIFNGGTYGSSGNHTMIMQIRKGNRLSVILGYFFPSYENMIAVYPKLKNRRWCLPFYYILRFVKCIFNGKAKKGVQVLKLNLGVKADKRDNIQKLLVDLQLK